MSGRTDLHLHEQLMLLALRDDSEDKVLLFFTRKLYPTIDPRPERRLVDRLRQAVFTDSPPDSQTATVAALANAAGH